MPVMNIRKVRVFVRHYAMFVPMGMRGRSVAHKRNFVRVLVMLIMRVTVLMGLGIMRMVMGVMLGQVQPNAKGH